MYLKFNNAGKLKRRQLGALLGTGAVLALAGCSGGSSGNNSNNSNAGLPSATLVALTNDNRLVTFNSRVPSNGTTVSISGLADGDTIRAIDFRFPGTVAGNGITGLYAIGTNNSTQQLYILSSTGAATAVGNRVTLESSPASGISIDFNPVVDRIRFVETGSDRNLRFNPNDGVLAGTDTPLAYADDDANDGDNPNVVAVAYTNVDADDATGTTLYGIDTTNKTLVTQGSINANPTSPNTGNLFTVANLTVTPTENTGFDIAGNNTTTGFLSINKRIYGIDLSSGATTGGAPVEVSGNAQVVDIAVVTSVNPV